MFSPIAQDQIIAQDQSEARTTTDDTLSVVSSATGQIDEEAKQSFSGLRKLMTTAVVAGCLGASSTPALTEEYACNTFVAEPAGVAEPSGESRSAVAQALSTIADRYESVLFSYPATVLDIERNASGDPIYATLLVSVDGNDTVIRRHVRQFSFDLKPDMRLIVDGVQRGNTKQLTFRIAQPLQLDEEQEELLRSIVSSFKTTANV